MRASRKARALLVDPLYAPPAEEWPREAVDLVVTAFNPWQLDDAQRNFDGVRDLSSEAPIEQRWATLSEILECVLAFLGQFEVDAGGIRVDLAQFLFSGLIVHGAEALLADHLGHYAAPLIGGRSVVVLSERPSFVSDVLAAVGRDGDRHRHPSVDAGRVRRARRDRRSDLKRAAYLASECAHWAGRRARGDSVVLASRHRVTEIAFSGARSPLLVDACVLDVLERVLPTFKPTASMRTVVSRLCDAARRAASELSPAPRRALERLLGRAPERLLEDAAAARRTGVALDMLDPQGFLAIGWYGGNHHAVRRWCSRNHVPFMVRQHGHFLGWEGSVESCKIDADVFLRWTSDAQGIDRDVARTLQVEGAIYEPALEPARERAGDENGVVLFAPSAHPEYLLDAYLRIWDAAIELKKRMPQLDVRARTHSFGLMTGAIKGRLLAHGIPTVESGGQSGVAAARESRVVVTTASTMGFDAALAGADVVSLNDIGLPDQFDTAPYAVHVNAITELVPAIERVLCDGPTRDRLEVGRDALRREYRAAGRRLDEVPFESLLAPFESR